MTNFCYRLKHLANQVMSCDEQAVMVDAVFDTDKVEAPFGRRYGGETLKPSPEQLQAMRQGKVLAVNVIGEYVLFIKLAEISAHE